MKNMKDMKTMKKALAMVLLTAVVLVNASGCGAGEKDEASNQIKVAMVHTISGLGDKSINDSGLMALECAKEELGISYTNVEPKEYSDYDAYFMELASSGEYDLIIALGAEQKEALVNAAKNFPEQKFSANSFEVSMDNISCQSAIWEEFLFMSGYLNARLTTMDALPNANDQAVIGILSAMEIPPQTRPVVGYICGAKYANSEVEVLTSMVGDFVDTNRAQELAIAQYSKGADIIQDFCGKAGFGLLNAAKLSNGYVTGAATNLNAMAPDYVPHSTLNPIENQMFDDMKAVQDGTWNSQTKYGGIKSGLFVMRFEDSNLKVPQEIIDEAYAAADKIASGELELPSTMEEIDQWVTENCK